MNLANLLKPIVLTALVSLGGAALFGAGGLILVWGAWTVARTRVELCAGGFRYARSNQVAVPWRDIRCSALKWLIAITRSPEAITALYARLNGRSSL